MPGVTAIIPTWNRRELLENLLASLARQTHAASEILVIDNGSSDGSAESARCAGARVIAMGENAGFSRAVNRGIRECRTEWLAVINNDVELDADWLARLLDGAEQSKAWFATGKLYRAGSKDMIDGAWDALSRGACAWRCGAGRPDGPVWSRARRIRFAPFTAALFRRELFARVGDLEEEFDSYLEDVEFGLRCARAGLWGAYVPEAIAWHRGSATLGVWHPETVRRLARNQLLLVAKHYPRGWAWRYGWAVLAGQLLWWMMSVRHGTGMACLRGKWEALRRFRRRTAPAASAEVALDEILQASEEEIRQLQSQTGVDWYWKLYFALT